MLRILTKSMYKRCYWTSDVPKVVVNKYELTTDLASILYNQNQLLDLIERQNIEQLKQLKRINEQLSVLLNKQ
jgi:hypothetical protein